MNGEGPDGLCDTTSGGGLGGSSPQPRERKVGGIVAMIAVVLIEMGNVI